MTNKATCEITLKQLEAFVATVNKGSFSGAAAELSRTQPTISKEIQRLEETLDVQLFDRDQGPATLKEEGHSLIKHARRMVADAHRFVDYAASLATGFPHTIHLACSPSLVNNLIPKLLQKMETTFPHVKLAVKEVGTGEVETVLEEQQADIGVCHCPREIPGFTVVPIGQDPLVLVGTQEIIDLVQDPADLSALERTPLMSWPRDQHPEYYDELIRCCQQRNLDPLVIVGSAQLTGSKQYLLSQGRAFGVLPRDAIRGFDPSLTFITLGPDATVELGCLVPQRPHSGLVHIYEALRDLHQTLG
ncbi:LysR family transcriptional regulator [Corynebacterium cystitidis]|uniref:LysR family transcriptional regulator n=1 Tax=Corynebacterium cystitidis TaxID=35757 RepID=UPI00211E272A|nr:LysR family transcriptional regulator [Corynebacterium cystitidis]